MQEGNAELRYSHLVERIGDRGADAWNNHFRALEMADRGERVVFLSLGDPDFDTPQHIVAAAKASLDAGRTHYTPLPGERRLREAVAAQYRRHSGCVVEADQVVILAGAQCALFAAMLCTVSNEDEVIVPDPMYITYEATIRSTGAEIVKVPSLSERGFRPDLRAIRAAITPRSRAILITTPHNPTGTVLTRDEFEEIAEICIENDLWLISDEVYERLAFDKPHVSSRSLPEVLDRTITISSLSKSHAMTGWRVGWIVGPRQLARHAANLVNCMTYGLPPFIQDAAVEALSRSGTEQAAFRGHVSARRDLVRRSLAGFPGIKLLVPEGGMFAMLDVRTTGLLASEFADLLLEQSGVCVLPGEAFGPSAAGYIRISLTASDTDLELGCARIKELLQTLSRRSLYEPA